MSIQSDMKGDVLLSGHDTGQLDLLGRRLRGARIRRRLTQAEMAERIGVHRLTYRALEHGAPSASLATLQRAMAVLGYPDRLSGLLEADPIGEEFEDITRRRVSRSRKDVADF